MTDELQTIIDKTGLDLQGTKVLCLVRFGSHLYGTNTEDSDTDYKGIFMPSKRMIYLNRIPKSISANSKSSSCGDKNTKEDIDCELYSLHYFIELACKGETVALDMIHVNKQNLIESSSVFDMRKYF